VSVTWHEKAVKSVRAQVRACECCRGDASPPCLVGVQLAVVVDGVLNVEGRRQPPPARVQLCAQRMRFSPFLPPAT